MDIKMKDFAYGTLAGLQGPCYPLMLVTQAPPVPSVSTWRDGALARHNSIVESGKSNPKLFLDHMQAPVPKFGRGGGIRQGRQMDDHFVVEDTGPPANVATGFDVSPDGHTIIYSRVDSLEHIDFRAGQGLPLCRRSRHWSWPMAEEALREQKTFSMFAKKPEGILLSPRPPSGFFSTAGWPFAD